MRTRNLRYRRNRTICRYARFIHEKRNGISPRVLYHLTGHLCGPSGNSRADFARKRYGRCSNGPGRKQMWPWSGPRGRARTGTELGAVVGKLTPFFYRTYPLLYHKVGNMVIFRSGNLYSLCSPWNQHYQQIIYF